MLNKYVYIGMSATKGKIEKEIEELQESLAFLTQGPQNKFIREAIENHAAEIEKLKTQLEKKETKERKVEKKETKERKVEKKVEKKERKVEKKEQKAEKAAEKKEFKVPVETAAELRQRVLDARDGKQIRIPSFIQGQQDPVADMILPAGSYNITGEKYLQDADGKWTARNWGTTRIEADGKTTLEKILVEYWFFDPSQGLIRVLEVIVRRVNPKAKSKNIPLRGTSLRYKILGDLTDVMPNKDECVIDWIMTEMMTASKRIDRPQLISELQDHSDDDVKMESLWPQLSNGLGQRQISRCWFSTHSTNQFVIIRLRGSVMFCSWAK
jgi:hypothetical protein